MRRARLTTLFLAALLAGCTVGPDYQPPEVETDDEWGSETGIETGRPDPEWWKSFDDPQLVRYVELAVEKNHGVAAARALVREARALRRVKSADLWPEAGAAASYSRFGISENAPGPLSRLASQGLAELEQNDYLLGFDASWEIDIFGGTRRASEAADARVGAAIEMERGVLLSLQSEVARNYVELRGAQREREALSRIVAIQASTLDLVRQRREQGVETKLEVQRATAELESTRSALPPLDAQIRASAYRLAVLTAHRPRALLEELLEQKPLPAPPEVVPVGLPSDLLRRRPDVREAERRLQATTADIGAATADLYPRFFLTGAAGLQSASFTDLFDASSRTWSLGPTIQWPVFQGGRIRATVDAKEARREAAREDFQQSVLDALAEVESALVSYAQAQLARRHLASAAKEQRDAVATAQALYENGLADFLSVLDTQRRLAQIERRLVEAEEGVLVRLIALYKALGGGWEPFRPEPALVSGGKSPEDAQPGE